MAKSFAAHLPTIIEATLTIRPSRPEALTSFAIGCMTLFATTAVLAVEPQVELLWPQGAPLAKGDIDNDKPTVTVYRAPPETATGSAIVICPGGGYGHLALSHEGRDIAEWMNGLGVTSFVLKYRHRNTGYGHPAPLLDAQRAVRFARANARRYQLKADQIGIIGFSAGGHLASTVGTHFDDGRRDAADAIDRVSSRPDFMILVYPVIALATEYAHGGSKKNLLGDKPDPKLVESLSNETQVTEKTPPTFLMHTGGDSAVPPENSVLFYLALRKAKVPAELHIYEKGGHGYGLAPKDRVLSSWPGRCEDWLRGRGIVK
ncbi:MAG: alpha/beta hydrolase [Pirellulales bacterium]